MATSSALSTSNQYIKYKITITQKSQNTSNNTSNVTVSVKFYRTNTGYTTYGTGTVYCKINGTTYSSSVTPSQKITSSGIVLFTKTLNVSHNSDGTKTLTCSAKISHDQVSSDYQSFSMDLTTIPRKSTLSVGNGTLGTSQTLTVTKQSSSFTHTIVATCGSASTTVCTKASSTSISFTPPLTWASQNTTGTSISAKYTITTYSGDTNIGSNSYTKTCSIPASVKPSCSISVSDSSGYYDTYGAYIKGLSKFKIVVTGTPSYGSGISSYSTTANGSTYTSSSFTTSVLKSYGTLTISSKVTDKRGRTGTKSVTATVLNYESPKITKLTAERCDSDGTLNDNGAYLKISYSFSATDLNSKNKTSWKIRYKKTADTEYTTIQFGIGSSMLSFSDSGIIEADTGSSYDIEFTITDNFKTTVKKIAASTGFTLMHWLASGLGMAIGKLSELTDYLDIGFKTMFRDDIAIGSNNKKIFGTKPDGTVVDSFNAQDQNGNTIVGYGNYSNKSGDTNIYGVNVNIGISDVASGSDVYKPYYSRGDVITLTFRTAGYITNSSKDISFWIPLAKPVIGSPTVTVTSLNGFVFMQGGNYTHGSGASTYVTPTSYEATATYGAGIYVKAVFSNITNAINNDAIGIYWNGQITLS